MTNHAVLLLGPDAPYALATAMQKFGVQTIKIASQAAEVHLPPDQASRVAKALHANGGFDVAQVPLEGREKKLLMCDMDSTIIGEESLDELAEVFGFGKKVAQITTRAMAGKIAFDQALRERVTLFSGLQIDHAASVLRQRMTINPGAEILVKTMRARGAQTALVTGGFDVFAISVAKQLGFHDVFANRLRSADGVLTGEVAEPILGPAAKEERLHALCKEFNLQADQVIAVGDGANDKAMIERAGLGIGYRPKPVLAEASNVVLKHADLTALLAIQGIYEDEWITA